MVHLNRFLLVEKSKQILKAKKHYLEDFDKETKMFTNKEFFYFFLDEGKKYIHKDSLRFCLTNADTYNFDINPTGETNTDPQVVKAFEKEIHDLFEFYTNYKGNFLPNLQSSKHFFYYDFVEGESITSITDEEFFKLKEFHDSSEFTPFYNSLCYNIVREPNNSLKIIDFKHFERKDEKPFFVYLYNEDHRINVLYMEKTDDLKQALSHLIQDYPVRYENIKWINKPKDLNG